jgi:hypothetical protein
MSPRWLGCVDVPYLRSDGVRVAVGPALLGARWACGAAHQQRLARKAACSRQAPGMPSRGSLSGQ